MTFACLPTNMFRLIYTWCQNNESARQRKKIGYTDFCAKVLSCECSSMTKFLSSFSDCLITAMSLLYHRFVTVMPLLGNGMPFLCLCTVIAMLVLIHYWNTAVSSLCHRYVTSELLLCHQTRAHASTRIA